MLKILIVEDEDFERRALKFLVEKYFSNEIQIVGEASNGQEALDQTFVLKPDLILMDINMPIMDGLKSSKMIKKLNKNIEILILTAYDTFTYAQEALKCGVSDYLVKPFTNKDFAVTISNAIENIRTRKTIISEQVQLDESFKKAIFFIEKRLVATIAYGDQFSIDELEESIKILKIKSLNACCLIIRNVGDYVFKKESMQPIKNILCYYFSKVVCSRFLGDIVFFIFDDNIKDIVLSETMNNILNKIKKHFSECENVDVKVQLGPIVNEIKNYNWSYNQAKIHLKEDNRPIGLSNSSNKDSLINIHNKENVILSKIVNEDLEGALEEIKLLMDLIVAQHQHNDIEQIKAEINTSLSKLINNLSDFLEIDRSTTLSNYIQDKISNLNNYNDISSYLSMAVEELIQDISSYNNISNINILKKAKDFINTNYMNDIRLEDVAKHVCISSYYFSRIFKKHEGINYIQYLTQIRMEKAKKLIIEDRNSIKEIAIDVGFMDQNYFSRAFKKYTGSSPKSFLYSIYECCKENNK